MPVDRASLKEYIGKLSKEDREALAEELGIAADASKADLLKALEAQEKRIKALEEKSGGGGSGGARDGKTWGDFFSIFGR
jgi:hypothetical protein